VHSKLLTSKPNFKKIIGTEKAVGVEEHALLKMGAVFEKGGVNISAGSR
jgi:coproporphyrinogen III oxidase